MMEQKTACIIGAGACGITAAKALKEHGIPFDCFEKGSGIGGNWRYKNDNGMSAAYRSLHINTSKSRMAYSDFPMPESLPDYPHHRQILEYFESYVDHFDLRPSIRFQTEVAAVSAGPDGTWDVRLGSGERRRYRAVLVANGHHWCPHLPSFPGELDGQVLHSHDYKTFEGFEDKRVVVLGMGNSAVDIACELSRVARRTVLAARRSAHILPKYAFGRPIDHFTTPLGSRLPSWLQYAFFKFVLGISRGPQDRFGVPSPEHGLLSAHPTISAELLNLVGHGKIAIKPTIEALQGDKIRFADGSEEPADVLILATGYKIAFPFFESEFFTAENNVVRLYRHVVDPDHQGLYFIGLIQPLGAVMPLAEVQAVWAAKLIAGECALPEREVIEREIDKDLEAMRQRYVASPRHTIQVDFFPYMRQLRREIRRHQRQPAA